MNDNPGVMDYTARIFGLFLIAEFNAAVRLTGLIFSNPSD
jgi:hypothetical protein